MAFQFGGLKGVAELWKEIVLELRWHWENLTDIPMIHVEAAPDFASCLLHQKLQMLQCCIRQQKLRQAIKEQETKASHTTATAVQPAHQHSADDDESDDEFFLAPEDEEGTLKRLEKLQHELDEQARRKCNEPQGVKNSTKTTLLESEATVNEPVTQDPGTYKHSRHNCVCKCIAAAPFTEDMLVSKESEMAQMGGSGTASAVRVHHANKLTTPHAICMTGPRQASEPIAQV